MIKLMNSAMMPREGDYYNRRLTLEEFAKEVKNAHENGTLESFIGYESTAAIIKQISGVPITISRAQTTIEHDDVLLIAKLKYRVNPGEKGISQPGIEDFEFFRCKFRIAGS